MNKTFFGRHISDLVYGANDGIITTFAVVSGATGASLEGTTIIILGLASLLADGFSMGSSKILSEKSERAYKELEGETVATDNVLIGGSATFGAFIIAGCLPLLPFFFNVPPDKKFIVSAVATGFALFMVGGLRSFVTKRSFISAALEMFVIGGIAAVIAYGVGWGIESIIT